MSAGGPLERFGGPTRRWFTDCFDAPTSVQAEGWPHLLDGHHTLMVAPTGSGKTLAAFLAALDTVSRLPLDAPEAVRILYVSPLKALVYDIERNLRSPLVGIRLAARQSGEQVRDIRVDIRTGDTSQRDRRRQAKHPADVLVTTPESLYLLLTSKARDTLKSVQTVIIDEIHVMAGTKRGVHLALSLERLSALADRDPQRVGLSATQRPLSAAATFLGGNRPVSIVDTAQPPRIDLEIVVPVEDMENPPRPEPVELDPEYDMLGEPVHPEHTTSFPAKGMKGGIWPTIHPRLLALIQAHRSTLVFVNSRLLCERLVQALNELAGTELVRAHHGSISHEQRSKVEEALKEGRVPAIVATSSLELGIDMGAIDLVILVESPGSTASGLQRIGRAGHQVGAVSRGRIFPKFRGDLLEATVVAGQMAKGHIETIKPPRNCLDVLAQQVVAMVAIDDWRLDDLHAVISRAGPYAGLTRELLVGVLDMLSGRYPSDAFSELTPTIVWDRASDTLKARRGARMLSVLNGGTIPDRGLYRVYLGSDGPRLGELDEEMVFESRQGDHIILGASTWRIDEITKDRVSVSPAPGQPGRLPFWRGERPGRPLELGRAMGAFLRKISAMEADDAAAWLQQDHPLDPLAARNLVAYIHDQREATGVVPSDRAIVIERFRDELGDWRVCVLTPLGARVHAPWALAVSARLTAEAGFETQAFWSDDGIAIRLADTDEMPDLDMLFPDPEEIEDLVVEELRESAMFAARFRESAARALLLPRRRARGRTPLWMQRRRAAALLASASKFPSFPIVLETYRECLQDVFDLPALVEILSAVRRREVVVHDVETSSASPFARGLVFQFVANYLYDGDAPLAERKAHALALDREMLRELLGQEQLRDLLEADAVDEVERSLQHLSPERFARHEDAVHDLLRRLGDLTLDELHARAEGDVDTWLERLVASRRVVRIRIRGEHRYVAVEDASRYRDALGVGLPPGLPSVFLERADKPFEALLLRYARTHGPFLSEELAGRYGWTTAQVDALLRAFVERGVLVHGELRPGGTRREWCDAEVLRRLRRRSLAKLRREVEPVGQEVLARFAPAWHGLDAPRQGLPRLLEVVEQLEGAPIPFSVLEGDVLPARVKGYEPMLLDTAGAMGMVVWVGRGALGAKDGRVALYLREHVPLLVDEPTDQAELDPLHEAILQRLLQQGASFLVQIQQHVEGTTADVARALWDLVWAGYITNDTFQPLRGLSAPVARGGRSRRARSRSATRIPGGRWSAVRELLEPAPSATERLHARVSTLLERHGVVARDTVKAEEIPGGFSALYPVLRAMEDAGRVRRGYFVEGLGGAQFAVPGAVDRLRAQREASPGVRVLGVTDPANMWGSVLPWPATLGTDVRVRRVPGARVVTDDGHPVLYLGPKNKHLVVFEAAVIDPVRLDRVVAALKGTLGYRSMSIDKVNGATVSTSEQTPLLLRAGFERSFKGLVLSRG